MSVFEVTTDPHDEPGYEAPLNKWEMAWLMRKEEEAAAKKR